MNGVTVIGLFLLVWVPLMLHHLFEREAGR